MKNKKEIDKLIEVAKRRIASIDVNNLNAIINKDDILVKKTITQNYSNLFRKEKIVKSIGVGPDSQGCKPRPSDKFLCKLNGKFHRIEMPEKGSFNAAIIRYDENKIICVYRPNETNFVACYLDNNYNVIKDSFYKLKIKNCADPRLIWDKNGRLLLIYSSCENVSHENEYIAGTILIDKKENGNFSTNEEFRISPVDLNGRQKNWMPFDYNGEIYLISSVKPHEVYHLSDNKTCRKAYHTEWKSPWSVCEHYRGNTNAVKLQDGKYLATFHTVIKHKGKHFYDNGCYLFSGKPPFNVLKCANKTYLPAEAACEKHFRKENEIVCNFPVGMIVENGKVIISYGDNDSAVKIVEYKLEDFLNTMVDV